MLWALREDGWDVPGMDVLVDGRVPLGAGLSSSAALECAVGGGRRRGCRRSDADDEVRRGLVRACMRAEREVAGAPTGGMDQTIALFARAGGGAAARLSGLVDPPGAAGTRRRPA